MKKTLTVLLTALLLCALSSGMVFAGSHQDFSRETRLADGLKTLSLFQGVSETDYALDRSPSRVEAIVMLLRLLGKEADALGGSWSHPFTDVPAWADPYVGYAYENGLTKGVSATSFGTGSSSAANYLTFVLRALGYSDAQNADFSWDQPFALAAGIGLLSDAVDTEDFLRSDVVLLSYQALNTRLKGADTTLAEKLIASGVFSAEAFSDVYRPKAVAHYSLDRSMDAAFWSKESAADQGDGETRAAMFRSLRTVAAMNSAQNSRADGFPAFAQAQNGTERALIYDDVNETLILQNTKTVSGSVFTTRLFLKASGLACYSDFSLRSESNPAAGAAGFSVVDPRALSAEAALPWTAYEGPETTREVDGQMHAASLRDLVLWGDYLCDWLYPGKGYSMAEFGFTQPLR
jgi:hypothetical protein